MATSLPQTCSATSSMDQCFVQSLVRCQQRHLSVSLLLLVSLALTAATSLHLQVGVVQGGLAAAAWSPDEELLVLASQHRQLLLMSKVSLTGLRATRGGAGLHAPSGSCCCQMPQEI